MSTRFIKSVRLAAAISSVLMAPSMLLAQTVYTGANNGDWATAGNWSAGVPVIGTNAQINNNASAVNVNLAANTTGNVNNLTIDAGDSLTLNNNATMNIGGNLLASGTLKFLAGANETFLNFASPTATTSGLIDFNYQGGAAAGVIQGPASGTLANNGTIRGTGSFRNIRFTNSASGLIESYQPSATSGIYIDANNGAAGLFVNQGTIRSLAGSLIVFAGDFGGDVNSTGGNIQANGAGAIVSFRGSASVTGGIYSTTGGGEIVVEANQTAFASPQSLSGIFRVRNNATINLSGNMANNGSIRLTTAGNASLLNLNAPLTLGGTGTLIGEYSGTGAGPRIEAVSHLLTLGANQTVSGTVYFNNSRVQNNGLIDANTAAGMLIDPNNQSAGLFVNSATMRSSGGGLLAIVGDFGGDLINNGTISAIGTNSITELANSIVITGGTYTNSGGGVLRVRSGNTATLTTPTITTGSTFNVTNNATLNLNGIVTTNGTLAVTSGANTASLTPTSAVTLAGTGTTRLSSNVGVSSATINNGGVVTIAAGHTLAGNGYLNNVAVINNGLVLADQTSGSMYLDPFNGAGTQFVNNATVRAVAGATMTLAGDNGGVFSGAGVYQADGANAFINLINSVNVVGGTVSTTNGGVVQIAPSQTATLTDTVVSAGSQLTVANNANLNLNGTPVLNGALVVNSGANNTSITIGGTTTLNTGTLVLNGNPGVSSAFVLGAGVLNIGPNFTVSGNGYFNNVDVNNAGTIRSDRATGNMYLDPNNSAADQFTNTGTIGATAGATLILAGDNGGNFAGNGIYRADGTNANVQLINSVTVNGGTFTTTAGGSVSVPVNQTATINGSAISAGSTFNVLNNARLYLAGTITNNGTLAVTSVANNSFLNPSNDVTLAGNGTVRLISNPGVSNATVEFGSVITIGAGQTVAGNGYFNNARVINNGLVLGDQATASMYLDPYNGAGTQFINNGTIRAAAGATVNLAGENGGTFSGAGAYVADGTIQTINSLGGSVDSPLTGTGTFRAASSSNFGFRHFRVANLEAISSGVARINAGGGTAGTSKVATIAINTSGRVDLTDHGMIVTAMTASNVRALIAPARNNGLWNGSGIGSSLANGNGKAVGYALASDLFTTGGTFLGQSFSLSDVLVRYTVNGDANLDGTVNFDDLLKLAQNYDTLATGTWRNGDFTYDGNINFDDLLALAQQYGSSLLLNPDQTTALSEFGGSSISEDWILARSMVPEPTSLGLIAAGSVLVRRRR